MGLQYPPDRGSIVIVDFELGGGAIIGSEMPKTRRPCIVIQNNKLHRGPLVTIVPISTTPPNPVKPWHHEHHELSHLSFRGWPIKWGGQAMPRWAKCDYLATVSLDRCTSPYGKDREGRKYAGVKITRADLEAVEKCVLWALGINPPAAAPGVGT